MRLDPLLPTEKGVSMKKRIYEVEHVVNDWDKSLNGYSVGYVDGNGNYSFRNYSVAPKTVKEFVEKANCVNKWVGVGAVIVTYKEV